MKKRYWLVGLGSFVVTLALFLTLLFPLWDKRFDVFNLHGKDDDLVSVGDEDPAAFIWNPGSGYGGMPQWRINKTYAKQFLKDNFKWRLQASPNNISWYDANELLKIGLDWIDSDCSYKVTLTLNTTTAPQSLFYRFDLAVDKSLKEYAEIDGYEWTLTVPANNTMDYTLKFNWSDIKPLIENGKVWFDRGVKNNFFWFRIQSVNKVAVGTVFVVDPVYGVITDAVVDSWEWDAQEGFVWNPAALVRLGTSEYYMTSAYGDTGSDYDGFLRTFKVWDSNGTIRKTLISTWEYDTSDGYAAGITHISGDIYAISYYDGGATIGKIITTTAYSSNGSLKKTIIDTENTYKRPYGYQSLTLIRVTGNIYALVYQENSGGYDHYMETFEITTAGAISAKKDYQVVDATSTGSQVDSIHACMVDSDTIAIVWCENVGYDVFLATYNISAAGLITNAASSSWEFETATTISSQPHIHHISGNVFAIIYRDVDLDGQCKTVTIADDGTITKSFIDTLEFETSYCSYPSMFNVTSGVYGVTYSGVNTDGFVRTFNITDAGAMDATVIDSLEFDTSDNAYYSPCVYVANDYYLIVYTSTGADTDGWACTVEILTVAPPWVNREPAFSNPYPSNSSVDVSRWAQLNITVGDEDGNSTTVCWYSNSSGSWYKVQQNNSVTANTTVRKMNFSNASAYSTKYWWKVTANDGHVNSTAWYCFTTCSPPVPASISLGGLTPGWNVTFDGDVPGPPGPEVVFCTSSGIEEETVEINIVVGEVDWVDEILFWASWLNDTINNTQIYTDNITVWVSDDNITWGILQDDVGSGMGRFPHTSGYLTWNFSTNPAGVDPFTYYPGYGYRLADDVTLYALYQLNITTTAKGGLHYNLSGSPWSIYISNNSDILDGASHTVQAEIRGVAGPTVWNQSWFSNMSFSNSPSTLSQAWSSNMSFSNTTTGFTQAWSSNMSFSNGSGLRPVQSWTSNMSFSNSTTGYVQGWISNMSFSNGTLAFRRSWYSNMSFSNGTGMRYNQGWTSNMSFSNTTMGFVQSWSSNMSFSNTTSWSRVWFSNMSFSNTTTGFTQGWFSNMSFSNGSGLRPVQSWSSNMSFSNSSLSYVSVWASNMSFSNTTVFIQVWFSNMSFSNGSGLSYAQSWTSNMSFSNGSGLKFVQSWSGNMSFSNTTVGFTQGWSSNMSFSNTTIFAQSWTSNMSFSNSTFVFGQSWFSNMSFSNGSGLRPVQSWFSNMSFGNSSPSATPFNINLYVHNPNPGNGTHSTNYLKRDSAGLTTSVDVVYQNFTTPGALIPGEYSMEFDSLHYSGPSIENNSGVYMDVNLNATGRVISGHEWVGQSESGGDYFIQRSYLIFNTTALVDTAVINSAYISMVVYQDYSDTDFNVSLQQVRAPAPHNPMIPVDYHRNAFVGEFNTKNTSGYNAEDWFNFSLPAAAFTGWSPAIDATGHSYFGLRSDQDVAQSAPGVGVDEWIGFYGPGGVHPWKAPHLIVNYTVPSSNWQHIVNLSWVSNSSGPWVEYNRSFVMGNGTVTVFNSNFSDVDTYYWYVSWESNSTNVGFSSTFEFETAAANNDVIITNNNGANYLPLLLVVFVPFIILLIIKRKKNRKDW